MPQRRDGQMATSRRPPARHGGLDTHLLAPVALCQPPSAWQQGLWPDTHLAFFVGRGGQCLRAGVGRSSLLSGVTEAAKRSLCQPFVSEVSANSWPGRCQGGRQRLSSSACLFLLPLRRAPRMSGVSTHFGDLFLFVYLFLAFNLLRYVRIHILLFSFTLC